MSSWVKMTHKKFVSAVLDRARFVARLTTGDGIGAPPPSNPRTQCDVLSARIAWQRSPTAVASREACRKVRLSHLAEAARQGKELIS